MRALTLTPLWTMRGFNAPITRMSTCLQLSRCRLPAMSSIQHADIQLRCACCGDSFVYSAGEQELHAVRGVAREPRVCPSCRKLLGRD
jgi:putative zinc ribbon protein